jgi:hypothetical protein
MTPVGIPERLRTVARFLRTELGMPGYRDADQVDAARDHAEALERLADTIDETLTQMTAVGDVAALDTPDNLRRYADALEERASTLRALAAGVDERTGGTPPQSEGP